MISSNIVHFVLHFCLVPRAWEMFCIHLFIFDFIELYFIYLINVLFIHRSLSSTYVFTYSDHPLVNQLSYSRFCSKYVSPITAHVTFPCKISPASFFFTSVLEKCFASYHPLNLMISTQRYLVHINSLLISLYLSIAIVNCPYDTPQYIP